MLCDVRFSDRPVGVKRFQTVRRCRVDVAHGLVLHYGRHMGPSLMGFEDEVERSKWRTCRQSNGRSKRTCELTSSIVPQGTSSTTRWYSSFLLSNLILHGSHAVTTSLVQRNSVPSTQMRCIITANRRAKATIAFFIPRRLAISIAQALTHDHFFEL